jgi:diaminopimelate epimerase
VAFVDVVTPKHLRILIWERGVGPTAASGTGACGSAVAAMTYGGADRMVDVESPGGIQRVEWREDGLYLTGWAEILLEGRWVAESA